MICPKCRSAVCRRSRRRGIRERLLGAMGFLPWRCGTCQARFQARRVALRFLYLVHCPTCGDLELKQVGGDRVAGGLAAKIQQLLRVPAYRCEACRHRFYSLRHYRPVIPTQFEDYPAMPQPPVPAPRERTIGDEEAAGNGSADAVAVTSPDASNHRDS